MKHNGRPIMYASLLLPQLVSLREGWRPMVACPFCGCWATVQRSMITEHRNSDQTRHLMSVRNGKAVPARRVDFEVPPCLGTGQRIRIDLSVEEWQTKLNEAVLEASSRRGTTIHPRPKPPVAPAVHQMAAARR